MTNGMKKRLLYLHNSDVSSRAANLVQVVSMCSAFAKAGYDTALVLHSDTPGQYGDGNYLHDRFGCDKGVRLVLIRRRMPKRLFRHLNHILMRRIVRHEKPDICFVRDPRYLKMVISEDIPAIMELHNSRLHLGRRVLDNIFRKLVLKSTSHPLCLMVVTISRMLADYWVQAGIPSGKIISLHDGFSAEMFSDVTDKKTARERLGLPHEKKIVVYTGNLQANRGINHILGLAYDFPELLFVLVGGAPAHKEHYQKECEMTGMKNIIFEGHQPHHKIPDYLFAGDILLAMWSKDVPTINYCSPLKVFEYLAAGKPLLLPGYPTIYEVAEDGSDSFIAIPDDPKSFRETLQRILDEDENTLEEMGRRAREKAMAQYTWGMRVAAIVERLPEEYRNNLIR